MSKKGGPGGHDLPPMTPEEALEERILGARNAKGLAICAAEIQAMETKGLNVAALKKTFNQQHAQMFERLMQKNERETGYVFPVIGDMEEYRDLLSANPWVAPDAQQKFEAVWKTVVRPQALAKFKEAIREARQGMQGDQKLWADKARAFFANDPEALAEIEQAVKAAP